MHTWKKNVSYLDIPSSEEFEGLPEETRELKSIQTNQIVLIPEGRWKMSGVDLIATLYQGEIFVASFPWNQASTC